MLLYCHYSRFTLSFSFVIIGLNDDALWFICPTCMQECLYNGYLGPEVNSDISSCVEWLNNNVTANDTETFDFPTPTNPVLLEPPVRNSTPSINIPPYRFLGFLAIAAVSGFMILCCWYFEKCCCR